MNLSWSLHVPQCLSESISAFFLTGCFPPCAFTPLSMSLHSPHSTTLHPFMYPLYVPVQAPTKHNSTPLQVPINVPLLPPKSTTLHPSMHPSMPIHVTTNHNCTPLHAPLHAHPCLFMPVSVPLQAPRTADSRRDSKKFIQYIVLKSTPGTSFRKIMGEFRTCRNKLSKERTVMVVFKNIWRNFVWMINFFKAFIWTYFWKSLKSHFLSNKLYSDQDESLIQYNVLNTLSLIC